MSIAMNASENDAGLGRVLCDDPACQPSIGRQRAHGAVSMARPMRRQRVPYVALDGDDCYASRVIDGSGARASRWSRRVVSSVILILSLAVAAEHLDAEETRPAAGGGVSGPPAPAAPAVAATPVPPAEPALPGAPAEPGAAARVDDTEPPPAPQKRRRINVWPWFDYESDPETRTTRVRMLGPLLEYRSTADRIAVAFRPFISIDQARVGHDDHVRVLGPLMVSHWGPEEQTTKGFFGLATYRTRTSADGRTLESQDARVLPFYFYSWERPDRAGRLSVAPFYADVEDLFGYERVKMIMFPGYLSLQRKDVERRYYLFYPVTPQPSAEAAEAIASLHRTAGELAEEAAAAPPDVF
jgi:hypothetical protein